MQEHANNPDSDAGSNSQQNPSALAMAGITSPEGRQEQQRNIRLKNGSKKFFQHRDFGQRLRTKLTIEAVEPNRRTFQFHKKLFIPSLPYEKFMFCSLTRNCVLTETPLS